MFGLRLVPDPKESFPKIVNDYLGKRCLVLVTIKIEIHHLF